MFKSLGVSMKLFVPHTDTVERRMERNQEYLFSPETVWKLIVVGAALQKKNKFNFKKNIEEKADASCSHTNILDILTSFIILQPEGGPA